MRMELKYHSIKLLFTMAINNDYKENDILVFKKNHPCGGNEWKVIRYGADCKLECTTCKRVIMISRVDISKRLKKIINN